jgi:hypothetical protein
MYIPRLSKEASLLGLFCLFYGESTLFSKLTSTTAQSKSKLINLKIVLPEKRKTKYESVMISILIHTCIGKKKSFEYVDFGPKNIKFKEIP